VWDHAAVDAQYFEQKLVLVSGQTIHTSGGGKKRRNRRNIQICLPERAIELLNETFVWSNDAMPSGKIRGTQNATGYHLLPTTPSTRHKSIRVSQ